VLFDGSREELSMEVVDRLYYGEGEGSFADAGDEEAAGEGGSEDRGPAPEPSDAETGAEAERGGVGR
jgi:hypothetical protein